MIHSRTLTLQNAAVANGNGAVMDVSGFQNISIQALGAFTATVNVEASQDGGTTWAPIPMFNSAGTNANTLAAPGILVTYFTGFLLLRARISGWASGPVTVICSVSG